MQSEEAYLAIQDALNGGEEFAETVELFYNGDIQSVYVYARDDKFDLMLDIPIYQDLHSYRLLDGRLTMDKYPDEDELEEFTRNLIFDLARLVDGSTLEDILNKNTDDLASSLIVEIMENSDRGFKENMVVYRQEDQPFVVRYGKGPFEIPSEFENWLDQTDNVIFTSSKLSSEIE